MTITTAEDLLRLQRIGQIVGLTLQEMTAHLQPGITTAELDEIGNAFMTRHGARSAPRLIYNFPGATCISLNDEVAHGIPGQRTVQAGDMVNIDVSAELDGYFADAALTIPIPPLTPLQENLCATAQRAQKEAIAVACAGNKLNAIGRAIEQAARRGGFTILRNLTGHGVGRHIHEPPTVPNFYHPRAIQPLTEGLVITIEPFIANRADHAVEDADGWTLKTPRGQLAAQYEHTIVVTKGEPLLVTAVV